MKVNTYLHFQNQCDDAFHFYEKATGGKIEMMMRYGDAPESSEHTPPEMKNAVIHGQIRIGDGVLMGSDSPPQFFAKPQGFSVAFLAKNEDEARRVYDALSAGGTATTPLQKTFFSPAFGMLTDKFGVPWMVNCDQQG